MSFKQYREILSKQKSKRPRSSGLICKDGGLSEEGEQRNLADYLDSLGVEWFHVPNGGARNAAEGGKLKAQGVKAGVPDNFIVDPPPKEPWRPGVVIELKRFDSGRVSPDQERWIKSLREKNWAVFVCHGAESAKAVMREMGYETLVSGRCHAGNKTNLPMTALCTKKE
ncbi:VRR-NUC domain-containing protein [Geoalkalibacter subterraneus]|uniref:VRR-NUC domain-containing protein n=1 Tax=Geoalkalibacter subterraneus TaxID=483547 RepID=UPI00130D683B|nr:VRR-NUC domain-containing protein [Geoalkalibacter subterraneus]